MTTVQRIARNTAVLFFSNIVSLILGFLFTVYVARHLAAEGLGVLSFALSFNALFAVLMDIGLQTLMIREIARDKTLARKYLSNIATMKIFLSIITLGLIALTINILHYPRETVGVVYLTGLSMIPAAFCTMFYGLFRSYESMEFEALGGVLSSALLLGGAIWAVIGDFGVEWFGWVYLGVNILILGYCLVVASWRFILPRIEFDLMFWKESLKQSWPFALSGVFLVIYVYVDSVMISAMKGNEAVGWYNVAYRLVLILTFLPGAYFGAIFPAMSRLHVASQEFLRFTHERSFKYMLILGVPIGVGTTILANKLILLIFGIQYYPSVIVLQIIVWSAVFSFISVTFFNLFQSVNRQVILGWMMGVGAVLKVALNFALIPGHSYTGAGIATLASSFAVLVISFIWISKIGYGISAKRLADIGLKVVIASAVMCVFVFWLQNFYILALIPLAALLYFAVLYIIGGIDKEDKTLLRQVIGIRGAGDSDN